MTTTANELVAAGAVEPRPEPALAAEILKGLTGFLEVLRCGLNYQAAPPELRNDAESLSPFHTRGQLLRALQPAKALPADMIAAWLRDPEHGLLHGFSVAFFAYLVVRRGAMRYFADDERLFASCLMHDFLRCSGLHQDHDRMLEAWFPRLLPLTYVHSHPEEQHARHPMVVGDRIELMRYPDHRDWVRPGVLEGCLAKPRLRALVRAYYRCVRPALATLFANWDGVWLRHSVEREPELGTAGGQGDGWQGRVEQASPGMFPRRYWAPRPGEWCVEVGRAPFGMNITRAPNDFRPFPVLNLDRYHALGGAPLVPFRDHFCARGRVPLDEWTVLLGDGDLERPECAELLSGCRGFVPLRVANRLLETGRYLSALLTAMGAGAGLRTDGSDAG